MPMPRAKDIPPHPSEKQFTAQMSVQDLVDHIERGYDAADHYINALRARQTGKPIPTEEKKGKRK